MPRRWTRSRFDDWPAFFVPEGSYKVQARENFDRGLPLALIALESQGMMKDRVYGITQTIYHAAVLHAPRGGAGAGAARQEGGRVRAQANYAVFRTRPGDASEVYNVGRYIDEIVRTRRGPEVREPAVRVRQRDGAQLADLPDLSGAALTPCGCAPAAGCFAK